MGWKHRFLSEQISIPLEIGLVTQVTDTYGYSPDLIADHFLLPTSTSEIPLAGFGKTDAMDYYSTWKCLMHSPIMLLWIKQGILFLENTSEQRFMGRLERWNTTWRSYSHWFSLVVLDINSARCKHQPGLFYY